jgi:hypothetical protein
MKQVGGRRGSAPQGICGYGLYDFDGKLHEIAVGSSPLESHEHRRMFQLTVISPGSTRGRKPQPKVRGVGHEW